MNAKSLLVAGLTALSVVSLTAVTPRETAAFTALRIHPKVFSLIDCWISDSERPVVTELNLDAIAKNGNEFNDEGLVHEEEWTRAPGQNSGFMRYRLLSAEGNHYKIEYQENEGGSLTTSCVIEFSIEKRQIREDGKSVTFRALRVLSIASK